MIDLREYQLGNKYIFSSPHRNDLLILFFRNFLLASCKQIENNKDVNEFFYSSARKVGILINFDELLKSCRKSMKFLRDFLLNLKSFEILNYQMIKKTTLNMYCWCSFKHTIIFEWLNFFVNFVKDTVGALECKANSPYIRTRSVRLTFEITL